MNEYKYRMSLAVPQELMAKANQLALIVGESSDDDKTFTTANWQDKDGNLYAVCSTVIKPIVLSLLTTALTDSVLTSETADIVIAEQAFDKVVMYEEDMMIDTDKIICGIDIDPLELFNLIGLTIIINEEL